MGVGAGLLERSLSSGAGGWVCVVAGSMSPTRVARRLVAMGSAWLAFGEPRQFFLRSPEQRLAPFRFSCCPDGDPLNLYVLTSFPGEGGGGFGRIFDFLGKDVRTSGRTDRQRPVSTSRRSSQDRSSQNRVRPDPDIAAIVRRRNSDPADFFRGACKKSSIQIPICTRNLIDERKRGAK